MMARRKFGDGRVGEVRYAAGIKVGIAERRGGIAASAAETEIPALSRAGALEAVGGQLDFTQDISKI